MQTVIITRGLPASGKSTWSTEWTKKHPTYKRINRDDLRMMMYGGIWNHKRERAVMLAREAIIHDFLKAGYNLILDDTNLNPERLKETINIVERHAGTIRNLMEKKKFSIKIKDFIHVPLSVCLARNALRPQITRVPVKFIQDYYNKYVTKLQEDRGQTKWTISY